MRWSNGHKRIVALGVLISLLGSIGLFCHGFSQVALAKEISPKIAVTPTMDECGNTPAHQKPSAPLQNDGRNKLLPCCYQKQEPGQISQNSQTTLEKRTAAVLQPLFAVDEGRQDRQDFFSHNPPNFMTDQLKTVVKRE